MIKYHNRSELLITLTDIIYKGIDSGKFTGVVFLDLKNTFETVDHRILLKKLSKYSINANALDWCNSYFSKRTQVVKVNCVRSSTKQVVCHVPQGSILGPLLFILYISNSIEYLIDCKINLYGNDTAV